MAGRQQPVDAPAGLADGHFLPYMPKYTFHTQVFRWASAMSRLQIFWRCKEWCHNSGFADRPSNTSIRPNKREHPSQASYRQLFVTRSAGDLISRRYQDTVELNNSSLFGVVLMYLGSTRWVEAPGFEKKEIYLKRSSLYREFCDIRVRYIEV